MYKITLTEIIQDKKAVIHTPTFEQDKTLREELHKRGLKWRVGSSYVQFSNYETYENETCLNPCLGLYGDIDGAKALRFTIHKFAEVDLTK